MGTSLAPHLRRDQADTTPKRRIAVALTVSDMRGPASLLRLYKINPQNTTTEDNTTQILIYLSSNP